MRRLNTRSRNRALMRLYNASNRGNADEKNLARTNLNIQIDRLQRPTGLATIHEENENNNGSPYERPENSVSVPVWVETAINRGDDPSSIINKISNRQGVSNSDKRALGLYVIRQYPPNRIASMMADAAAPAPAAASKSKTRKRSWLSRVLFGV
jgi:hypothetical protein